jgi:hypothetical protein
MHEAAFLKTSTSLAKSAGIFLDLILVKKGTPGFPESQNLRTNAMHAELCLSVRFIEIVSLNQPEYLRCLQPPS